MGPSDGGAGVRSVERAARTEAAFREANERLEQRIEELDFEADGSCAWPS
jgi:hypothetical protein